MRTRTLLVNLAAAAVVGGLLTAPAAQAGPAGPVAAGNGSAEAGGPAIRRLDVASLPRGKRTRLEHLRAGYVHRPDGTRVRVRPGANAGEQALLGRSGSTWVVAGRRGDLLRIHTVTAKGAATLAPRSRSRYGADEKYVGDRLSRDGGTRLRSTVTRDGVLTVARDLETGQRLGAARASVLDVADGVVVGNRGSEMVVWRLGGAPEPVAKQAQWASIGRDIAFVKVSHNNYGPTSISAPGEPAWSARFAPLDVSPDGSLVLGTRFLPGRPERPVLQLRRMSDGELLAAYRYGPGVAADDWSVASSHEQSARFETDKAFVFQMNTRRGAVLVRCRTNDNCRRASGWGGDFSFTGETYLW